MLHSPYMNTPRDTIIGFFILGVIGLAFTWYVVTHPDRNVLVLPADVATEPPGYREEHGQYFNITASYPTSGVSAENIVQMKEWQEALITQFKTESGLLNLTAEDIQIQGLGEERKYALGVEYKTYTGVRTVSYVYLIYQDTLGAHPNVFYRTFTFDTKTNATLTLGDVFAPGSHYLETLSAIARAELPAMVAARAGVTTAEVNIDYINDGTEPEETNFENFYLDGSDLVILFPPYQIGPYVLGSTEFHIPLSELSDLKAEYK